MNTSHIVRFQDACRMSEVDESVDLVVTSPPYPMIAMWDEMFSGQSESVAAALQKADGMAAFEAMHQVLDRIWSECYRVLRPGGFMCVNIGDAVRTVGQVFRYYDNRSRIIIALQSMGLDMLPPIVWRKVSNSPNKFMGSGMLPCGAYVTLEHEHILIFRKGKRTYPSAQLKAERRKSAYFWEERNRWFSDVWEVTGVSQVMYDSAPRSRNASYPMEIPLRLILMYSQMGDVVLDPFAGLCTTTIASMLTGRDSVGYEVCSDMRDVIAERLVKITPTVVNDWWTKRVAAHQLFTQKTDKPGTYTTNTQQMAVKTRQETDIVIPTCTSISIIENCPIRVGMAFGQ